MKWVGRVTTVMAIVVTLACETERARVVDVLAAEPSGPVTILALGDSYTIGTAVAPDKRWPAQLGDSLEAAGVDVGGVTYVAKNGWTTGDLIAAVDTFAAGSGAGTSYDLVTLLIGVNNQFGGLDIDDYAVEFESLLVGALGFAGDDTTGVVVLSIPDYGVTPVGMSLGEERIAREIDAFNDVNRAVTQRYGVDYVDVTPLSREARGDPALVARDDLHFSGEMYRRWVSLMVPTMHVSLP